VFIKIGLFQGFIILKYVSLLVVYHRSFQSKMIYIQFASDH
jgi:hypothetical protein